MKRRTVLSTLAVGGLVVTGSAAGGLALGRAARDRRRPWETSEDDLVVLSGRDQSPGRQRDRLILQWNALHPDFPARLEEIGGVADAHRSEMVARAQAGAGVDLFNLDVTWIAEFAEAGYIRTLPATDLDTEGYLERPMDTCSYGGELWALPFNTDAGLLFYRTDLVSLDGRRADWSWIAAETSRLLDEYPELEAGYAGQLADYEGLTVNALERIWAEDGEVVSGDWWDPVVTVDTGRNERALAALGSVFRNEAAPVILPDAVDFDEAATTRAFQEGRIAFMRNWPVAYRLLQPHAEGEGEPGGVPPPPPVPFAVTRLPGDGQAGPSVLGGQNLAIARRSDRPWAAQALLEFLTSDASQSQLFRAGGLAATRAAVYDDEQVVAEHPYAELLKNAVEDARPRMTTPYYARFSEVFRAGVRSAMRQVNGEFPEGFADQLADALRGLRT